MGKIELLRQIQADSLIFFMKVHNFHWNVKGRDFFQVHRFTEEVYDRFKKIFDDVAERLLQLSQLPIVTVSDALKETTLKEEARTSFSGDEVFKSILEDYNHFLSAFGDLARASEGDVVTQDYANENIAFLEKAIWMLEAQLS